MPEAPDRLIQGRYVPIGRHVDTEGSIDGGGMLGNNLRLRFRGDIDDPPPFSYYGTDIFGERSWLGVFGSSGLSHSAGLVPDPGVIQGNSLFLREDGLWQLPTNAVSSVFGRTGAVVAQAGDYSASDVGLGSVTNDAQTKAVVVPNTAPSAGQILVGGSGPSANVYLKQTISGSGATITCGANGVITISGIANGSLANSSITIAGTSTALGGAITLDTILGLAANGLLKRTGANTYVVVTAPSGAVVGDTDTQTLTNKRVTNRESTAVSASTITPDISAFDIYQLTTLAANLTINNPIGSPIDGDELTIIIRDNAVSKTLTWGSEFLGSALIALPAATTASKVHVLKFLRQGFVIKWLLVNAQVY